MIGWVILCIVIVTAAFTSAILDVNYLISLLIMLTALVPGYYIFKLSMQYPKRVRHNPDKQIGKAHIDKHGTGRVINFPKGGRTKFDKTNKN